MNDFASQPVNEFTPTDPALDGLLDEALAAGDAPAGLNQRILAATTKRLPRAGGHDAPVIARLGESRGFMWRSLAAVMLFALLIGGVWWGNREADAPTDSAGGGNGPAVVVIDEPINVGPALAHLAEAERDTAWVDDRIELLSMQVAWADDAGLWGDGALESLDTAIARSAFDELADEWELYF